VLKDLVKVDDDNDSNQVAIREGTGGKRARTKGEATAVEPFDIRKAILADADVRDQKPTVTTLRKDSSVPDWSWSTPVYADALLSKRAHGSARERLREQLRAFFAPIILKNMPRLATLRLTALAEELAAVETDAV